MRLINSVLVLITCANSTLAQQGQSDHCFAANGDRVEIKKTVCDDEKYRSECRPHPDTKPAQGYAAFWVSTTDPNTCSKERKVFDPVILGQQQIPTGYLSHYCGYDNRVFAIGGYRCDGSTVMQCDAHPNTTASQGFPAQWVRKGKDAKRCPS